jgi:hypothetical protein
MLSCTDDVAPIGFVWIAFAGGAGFGWLIVPVSTCEELGWGPAAWIVGRDWLVVAAGVELEVCATRLGAATINAITKTRAIMGLWGCTMEDVERQRNDRV